MNADDLLKLCPLFGVFKMSLICSCDIFPKVEDMFKENQAKKSIYEHIFFKIVVNQVQRKTQFEKDLIWDAQTSCCSWR